MTQACEQIDVVLGVTGASGAALGVAVLQTLNDLGVRVHLVITESGKRTLSHEAGVDAYGRMMLKAHRTYDHRDIGSAIASGSFPVSGMIIAPCSMKTLAAISTGLSEGLVARAADVQLKERRRLVLMTRETPLHLGHLRNMVTVTEMGAIVMPPVPAFYNKPKSVGEVVEHLARRAVDLLAIPVPHQSRAWSGEAAFDHPRAATGSTPKSRA
ncbi:polyprenyl p-hydroxybenzoate/phenylacrylic acid decarboxylase [Rhizobium leguminosarum bv. trifolii WSM597]|uniref:Flavin prenyltransferase UbiX n=1 Tax=Rhizobium leguminosarum bv. trifolii WSM597 TaxID=754764 RepID=I9XAF2_RHILT|nr:UbiX family flavin prenyltransferase [Rhizobium leguminosarum]EJB05941.1 polyprenyl p-hydroxybenzoate/phenylacrylic acid decarboxylase [Rhizobium leguminosarum bv. trifolii WSM597]